MKPGQRSAEKFSGPVIVIMMAITGCASSSCRDTERSGDQVDTIRALEEAGARTNLEGQSLEEAERIFADDFKSYLPDGSVITKPALLGRFGEDGRLDPWARTFAVEQLDIAVYCTTALVKGKAVGLALAAPKTAPPTQFDFFHVWIRRPEGWAFLAQTTSIEK